MHELFLTTHIADGDVSKATCILQGYCEMPPVPILNRRLIFDVPRAIKFKGIDPVFVSKQPPHKTHLWRALHEQLIRNLFIVTLLYPVTKDQFGTEESTEENISMFDEQLGTLYWADLPDPASTRPVNSRNVISIEHERALTTVVSSLGYRLSTEFIQEGYRFIRGNIMIQLCRYFELPTSSQPESNSQPRVNLPSFESLIPFDSQGKWIMTASVDVINSTDPDQMLRATDELVALKQAFEGCFAFKLVDRHTLDTRVKF